MNSFDCALSSGRLLGFFCWAKVYVRFFRWASDRIDENGIVAFVSNFSFIDGKTFDGFRDVVAEFGPLTFGVDRASDRAAGQVADER
jgi:predicted helicase